MFWRQDHVMSDAQDRPGGEIDLDGEPALVVIDREGRRHRLAAPEGWRAMEVIRDWGLPIKAECGGAAACGSCHVHVDAAWAARLPAPNEDEMDRLDEVLGYEPNSRLSCQIIMSRDLDGLVVTLAPGSEP